MEETKIPGIKITIEDIHAIGHRLRAWRWKDLNVLLQIDNEVIAGIEDCMTWHLLHNPANLKGIYAAREIFVHKCRSRHFWILSFI